MIKLPFSKCTGCAGCMNICPVQAIQMQEDQYGFIHPNIDVNKCIKCHLCEKTCPVYTSTPKNDPINIMAAVSVSHTINLRDVASGGVASTLAEFFIQNQGVVYGCSEKNFSEIKHIRVDSLVDIKLIQNSKYVQSEIGYIFKDVENDLKNNRQVLFIGTPCQIAGLINYLKKDYPNLLTVDFVCHGVPPLKMLKDQVSSYIKRINFSHQNIFINFRWKERINDSFRIKYGFQVLKIDDTKKPILIKSENDIVNPYMRGFQKGLTLRDSCFQCQYALKQRVSDITVGDFWGLGSKIKTSFKSQNGVSLLLINSEKGLSIFSGVSNQFLTEEHSFENVSKYNLGLIKPFPCPSNRAEFLDLYKKIGLRKALKHIDSTHRFYSKRIVRFMQKNKYTNFSLVGFLKIKRILSHGYTKEKI